jgi:hypothetical protein
MPLGACDPCGAVFVVEREPVEDSRCPVCDRPMRQATRAEAVEHAKHPRPLADLTEVEWGAVLAGFSLRLRELRRSTAETRERARSIRESSVRRRAESHSNPPQDRPPPAD